MSQITRRVF